MITTQPPVFTARLTGRGFCDFTSVDELISEIAGALQFSEDANKTIQGDEGDPGQSAYGSWLALGNAGTEAEFIASLKGVTGEKGDEGDSAFSTWLALPGNNGKTEADFIASLKGEVGAAGPSGSRVVVADVALGTGDTFKDILGSAKECNFLILLESSNAISIVVAPIPIPSIGPCVDLGNGHTRVFFTAPIPTPSLGVAIKLRSIK